MIDHLQHQYKIDPVIEKDWIEWNKKEHIGCIIHRFFK